MQMAEEAAREASRACMLGPMSNAAWPSGRKKSCCAALVGSRASSHNAASMRQPTEGEHYKTRYKTSLEIYKIYYLDMHTCGLDDTGPPAERHFAVAASLCAWSLETISSTVWRGAVPVGGCRVPPLSLTLCRGGSPKFLAPRGFNPCTCSLSRARARTRALDVVMPGSASHREAA